MVLNYLSDAAGFIIVLETKVEGKIDAWSNQPLSKEEAVTLLNSVLNKNKYAAIQNGRTLTIVSQSDAKKRDIPVRPYVATNGPASIPKTDQMVTQIIPIRYANATQITKDLQPLLPDFANLTANESANALVLTDTQANVRRMVEIVQALDTAISGISTIRVFQLQFADAKELATAVKELFAPSTQQNGGNGRAQAQNRFRGGGGGGFPGFPGGGGGGDAAGGTGVSEARNAASHVVALADERSNALIVSAPDEFIPSIEQLVREVDVSVSDITELRVFRLKMTELFGQLFPDETKTANNANQNQGFRFGGGGGFGGFGGGGGGRGQNNQSQTAGSDRAKKKGRVLAVADQRTSSIIVSAASEMMPQIAAMVAQLDADAAKKQKVFVYDLQNADPQAVQEVLRNLFENQQNVRNTRQNNTQNSALSTRAQQSGRNNTGGNTGGFGGGGGGGLGGGGGGGGGGLGRGQ